ncbi:MAG: nicotinate-nucleotide--dimethylbenzimidazole phosphoribosyltransferase [Planktomarina sp.]
MTHRFSSLAEFRAIVADLPVADQDAFAAATDRNSQLTKPPGALGQLEELAIWYASWGGSAKPEMNAPQVVIFAGNHGVAATGVSAFPPEVTEQMVFNFQAGGAAINQLCKAFGAKLDVHALELDRPTANFTDAPAMSEAEVLSALQTGWDAVDSNADLLVTGEMGIGNTTPAAAIAAALYGGGAEAWVGRGTGVDDVGLALKRGVVDAGLAKHAAVLDDPLAVLQCLGGREIAAMAGAMMRARVERIPMLLDGFISTSAAAVLHAMNDAALDHMMAGHQSGEGAHGNMLDRLGKTPLLSLGLRLGEGSGGTLAIGVLKGAIACHSGMATFAEAGVSDA